MESDLKRKAFSGFLWMFMERIGAQLITFCVSIVLARILFPEDYGVIAIAQIFINLMNVFVTQGLNASLIQRDEAGDLEYSTAFFANLGFSLILYMGIFLSAPFISEYYGNTVLCPILRVMGLRLIIGAFNSIQRAYVSRHLQFKKFFFATLGATIISAFVGIGMALAGMGPWAIAGQYLTNAIIGTIVLWFTISWHPKRMFSKSKFMEMFGFGWKIFIAAFCNELYLELRSLVIAKKYSSSDLAYYIRGKQFPELFYTNLNATITSVMFQIMSKQKDDLAALNRNLKRTIQVETYLIMPLMIGLTAVAEPLVKLLLTDKWLLCVPFLCAYCISYTVLPIQSILEQLYKAVGRSDIVLKLFFVEKFVGILVILYTMHYSVWAIAVGMVCTSLFSTLLHGSQMKAILNYSLIQMMKDIFENVVLCLIMYIGVRIVGLLPFSAIIMIIIQCITGVIIYLTLSILIKSKSLKFLLQIINSKMHNSLLIRIENML